MTCSHKFSILLTGSPILRHLSNTFAISKTAFQNSKPTRVTAVAPKQTARTTCRQFANSTQPSKAMAVTLKCPTQTPPRPPLRPDPTTNTRTTNSTKCISTSTSLLSRRLCLHRMSATANSLTRPCQPNTATTASARRRPQALHSGLNSMARRPMPAAAHLLLRLR